VIATDWSGNVDFTRGTSYEVPAALVPVSDSSGRYGGSGQTWAEPDMAAAVAQMRRCRDDPAGRAAIARRGQHRIRELCSGLPRPPHLAVPDGHPLKDMP